jgi:hypothetical protein
MIALALMAQALAGAPPSSPSTAGPIVIQSLCTPVKPAQANDKFTFELIQTDGKWSNRLVPGEGSAWPAKAFAVSEPKVEVLPSPRGRALLNTGSAEFDGHRYFFVAIADIMERELADFSVSLSKGPTGIGDKPASILEAKCVFSNKMTTKKAADQ